MNADSDGEHTELTEDPKEMQTSNEITIQSPVKEQITQPRPTQQPIENKHATEQENESEVQFQPSNQITVTMDPGDTESNTGQSTTELHKFVRIDPEKESQIEYVKLETSLRVAGSVAVVSFLVWLVMLINSIAQHVNKHGSVQYGYCDGIGSCSAGFDAWEDMDTLHHCNDFCGRVNGEPAGPYNRTCWDHSLPNHIPDIFEIDGWCADFNNESSAVFWGKILLIVIILLWCWKFLKKAWKGVQLPTLEKKDDAQLTGCKRISQKIRDVSDKVYDLKIDIRPLVERYTQCCGKTKMDDTKGDAQEKFIKMMKNSTYFLFAINVLVFQIPFQILNVTSSSLVLQMIGFVSIVAYATVMPMVMCCSRISKKELEHFRSKSKELNLKQMPERNVKFILCLSQGGMIRGNKFALAMVGIAFAVVNSPNSNYDFWMKVLNIVKGIYVLWTECGIVGFQMYIIFPYYQKENVSRRESLLLREHWRKSFSWSIFKVGITDQDRFVYVDENRASAEAIASWAPSSTPKVATYAILFMIAVFLWSFLGFCVWV
eukprot:790308_1